MAVTPRRKFTLLDPSDGVSVPDDVNRLAAELDDAPRLDRGTLAQRPPAGDPTRIYRARDTAGGFTLDTVWVDTGVDWLLLSSSILRARGYGGQRGGGTTAWGGLFNGGAPAGAVLSPTITLPADGDYEIEFGAALNAPAGNGEVAIMALAYQPPGAGTATVHNPDSFTDAAVWHTNTGVPQSAYAGINSLQTLRSEPLEMTGRVAGTVVTAQYRAYIGYGGVGPGFSQPWIRARLVRA